MVRDVDAVRSNIKDTGILYGGVSNQGEHKESIQEQACEVWWPISWGNTCNQRHECEHRMGLCQIRQSEE